MFICSALSSNIFERFCSLFEALECRFGSLNGFVRGAKSLFGGCGIGLCRCYRGFCAVTSACAWTCSIRAITWFLRT